jgi:hypothetical protein
MIVRIASVQVAPERIDEMIRHHRETLRPVHEQCQGLRHHYWLVDRYNGHVEDSWLLGFSGGSGYGEAGTRTGSRAISGAYQETPTLEAYEVADEI